MRLGYQWDLPSDPRPIVLIGDGGIVNDAHLPACQIAKFPVLGIHDINSDNLKKTADLLTLFSENPLHSTNQ